MTGDYCITVHDKHGRKAHIAISKELLYGTDYSDHVIGTYIRKAVQTLQESKDENIYARIR